MRFFSRILLVVDYGESDSHCRREPGAQPGHYLSPWRSARLWWTQFEEESRAFASGSDRSKRYQWPDGTQALEVGTIHWLPGNSDDSLNTPSLVSAPVLPTPLTQL